MKILNETGLHFCQIVLKFVSGPIEFNSKSIVLHFLLKNIILYDEKLVDS